MDDVQIIALPASPELLIVVPAPQPDFSLIVIPDNDPEVVTVIEGIVGPAGPGGDTTIYANRADIISDALVYRAEAIPGSVNSDPVWRIRKIIITNELISTYWAGGSDAFDKIWDNRLAYGYS